MRPGFREDLEILIKNTIAEIKPKLIKNITINGLNFAELIIYFVERINQGLLPSITSANERVIEKEYLN